MIVGGVRSGVGGRGGWRAGGRLEEDWGRVSVGLSLDGFSRDVR